jgi:hypothetical protein
MLNDHARSLGLLHVLNDHARSLHVLNDHTRLLELLHAARIFVLGGEVGQ